MLLQESIATTAVDLGLCTMFGVVGGANLGFVEAFLDLPGTRYVSTSNEVGAVLAAAGYAMASGFVGIATVGLGPALSNTLTALIEAAKSRTPLVVIAGDTAENDVDNYQSVRQREIVVTSGAAYETVLDADRATESVRAAVQRAHDERRPVVLGIPANLFRAAVDHADSKPLELSQTPANLAADELDAALGVIASARRPVILAGRGAATERDALVALGDQLGAFLLTTLRAKDLFGEHPSSLGICGTLSSSTALDALNRSDCVIAFGASLNRHTTAGGSLLAERTLVRVDADRRVLDGQLAGVWSVLGDTGQVAAAFSDHLTEAQYVGTQFNRVALNANETARRNPAHRADTVDLTTAIELIDTHFSSNRTLTLDGGRFLFTAARGLRVPVPGAYIHTVSTGSIGLGMGSAIGATLGAPERAALLVCGDGGFMLGGLAELSSAVRHDLDLTVVVLNDGAYGAEYEHLQPGDPHLALCLFEWPDFGPVATALGATGFTARTADQLVHALTAASTTKGTTLIDVKLDPASISMDHL